MKLIAILLSLCFFATIVNADIKCNLCLDAVKELEQYLKDNENNAEGAADAICTKISGGFPLLRGICDELFDREIEHLIDGIEKNEPPRTICQSVNMC
uniref:Saposin B-type domain-containing protein n=1 Tax=Rhabditophanes sp. KR3021 TaxID=114890 RepID=A0AC35UHZ3_9BILA